MKKSRVLLCACALALLLPVVFSSVAYADEVEYVPGEYSDYPTTEPVPSLVVQGRVPVFSDLLSDNNENYILFCEGYSPRIRSVYFGSSASSQVLNAHSVYAPTGWQYFSDSTATAYYKPEIYSSSGVEVSKSYNVAYDFSTGGSLNILGHSVNFNGISSDMSILYAQRYIREGNSTLGSILYNIPKVTDTFEFSLPSKNGLFYIPNTLITSSLNSKDTVSYTDYYYKPSLSHTSGNVVSSANTKSGYVPTGWTLAYDFTKFKVPVQAGESFALVMPNSSTVLPEIILEKGKEYTLVLDVGINVELDRIGFDGVNNSMTLFQKQEIMYATDLTAVSFSLKEDMPAGSILLYLKAKESGDLWMKDIVIYPDSDSGIISKLDEMMSTDGSEQAEAAVNQGVADTEKALTPLQAVDKLDSSLTDAFKSSGEYTVHFPGVKGPFMPDGSTVTIIEPQDVDLSFLDKFSVITSAVGIVMLGLCGWRTLNYMHGLFMRILGERESEAVE